jgi:hypothetical protein
VQTTQRGLTICLLAKGMTPEERINLGRQYAPEYPKIKIVPPKKKYYIEANKKRSEERRKRRLEKQ